MTERMTRETAVAFFAELFGGEHHIPKGLREWGIGWAVTTSASRFATFDFNDLTRAVFLAHDRCLRLEVNPGGPRRVTIAIHQRVREGGMSQRHPTLEAAVAGWRRAHPEPQEPSHAKVERSTGMPA